jgi:hypothetical protein
VGERWSVVGVIAGEPNASQKPTGIAVLRNNQTQRTYTLTIGDPVPTEFGYFLRNVLARNAVIGNDRETVTLSFSEPAAEVVADSREVPASRTSRFLDTYYRSFDSGDASFDDFGSEEAELPPPTTPRVSVTRGMHSSHYSAFPAAPYRADDEATDEE